MLCLTRSPDPVNNLTNIIKIGDDIEISIVWVKGDRVRIGITAPRDVAITRPDAADQTEKHRKGRGLRPGQNQP